MVALKGIVSCISTISRSGTCSGIFPGILSQVRHYAARKGTREKAKKKKVKREVKILTFDEKVKRSKRITIVKPDALRYNDSIKSVAKDDVFINKFFKWRVYSFAEAIQSHREFFHPTMYDIPDAIVSMLIELNMEGVKSTKPVDSFRKIVPMKHHFDHGEERNILAFCKEDLVKEALDAGAALAGGADIVKLIVNGEISLHNYDTVVAHPSMLPELTTIRGLLKQKSPNPRGGTLGPNLKELVHTHLYGIKYQAKPYDHFPKFGYTNVMIGRLNMDLLELQDNMKSVIDSIMSVKPKRPGEFITRIRISCTPSKEKFKIDHNVYIEAEEDPQVQADDGSDDEVAAPVSN